MVEGGRAWQAEAQLVEGVLETGPALGAAMHGDAGRLVEDEHQPVAVKKAREEIHAETSSAARAGCPPESSMTR